MRLRGLFGSTALCGLLAAPAAQALTAAEVLQSWKDFAALSNQTLTSTSETMTGDTLVVTGMTSSATEDGMTFVASTDEVRFRELGDGTVEVTMSPDTPLVIDGTNAEGKAAHAEILISQPNLRIIAAGTPEESSYQISADSLSVTTTTVTEDGVALPIMFSLVAEGPGGSYSMTRRGDDLIDLTSTINAQSLALALQADDQEIGSKVDLSATVAQLAAATSGTYGSALDMEQFAAALAAGFATDVGLTYGPLAYNLDLVENAAPTKIQGKSDGGALGIVIDKTRMAFRGGGKGVQALISGAEIPFPQIVIQYAESAFDFAVPVSKSPDPQNYTMVAKLIGLTVSEEIWAMIDPTATLPRDPATAIIDARGTVRLDADLTSPEAQAADLPPGALLSFDLPALQLTVAGAELTGAGAFTFDNSDLTTFDGMPAPTGKVDLRLSGGNGLLDKLTALGLVPEEQVMGARMMMGMFARPGDGPDTLTSTLEVKDKKFFANGMQLN